MHLARSLSSPKHRIECMKNHNVKEFSFSGKWIVEEICICVVIGIAVLCGHLIKQFQLFICKNYVSLNLNIIPKISFWTPLENEIEDHLQEWLGKIHLAKIEEALKEKGILTLDDLRGKTEEDVEKWELGLE